MTLSTTAYFAERAWTGAETSFDPGFPAMRKQDVRVAWRSPAGNRLVLSLDVHFGVTLNAETGMVTVLPLDLPAAPATLEISRRTDGRQQRRFRDDSRYSEREHERGLDEAAMRDAEMRGDVDKALALKPALDDVAAAREYEDALIHQRLTELQAAYGLGDLPAIPPRGSGVAYVVDYFVVPMVDYTPAYQRAHDEGLPASGGVIVGVNAPHSTSGPVTFTKATQCWGHGWQEGPLPAGGSWIQRTDLDACFIFSGMNARGGSLKGFAFYDTLHPAFGPGWAPAAYVPAVQIVDTFGQVTVDQMLFANCRYGIECVGSGRFKLGMIMGQFYDRGVYLDRCLDCPYIGCIHNWPFRTAHADVLAYTQANCDVLVLGRVDTPFIGTVFGIDVRSPIRFVKTADGVCTRGQCLKVQGDHAVFSLLVDVDVVGATCDFGVVDGQGENPAAPGYGVAGSNALRINGEYSRIAIDRLRTAICGGPAIAVFGPGNWIDIDKAWIGGWDTDAVGGYAFHVEPSGSDINQLTIGQVRWNNGSNTRYTLPTNAIVEVAGIGLWNTGGRPPTDGNWIDNGNFSVNQRGVAGTVTLAAGEFGHDRWKAGAAGCTYTFANDAAGNGVITITGGSLVQVFDRSATFGDTHILSWFGSAKAKVNGGAWLTSPWPIPLNAGLNTVEFGKDVGDAYPVTLAAVRAEAGLIPHRFEQRPFRERLDDCQYYFQRMLAGANGEIAFAGYQAAGAKLSQTLPFLRQMRVAPGISAKGSWSYSNVDGSTLLFNSTPTHAVISAQATATGALSAAAQAGAALEFSADL